MICVGDISSSLLWGGGEGERGGDGVSSALEGYYECIGGHHQ